VTSLNDPRHVEAVLIHDAAAVVGERDHPGAQSVELECRHRTHVAEALDREALLARGPHSNPSITTWVTYTTPSPVEGGAPPRHRRTKPFRARMAKHICLGSQVARLETRILLQEALRRLPDLHMDDGKPFKRFAGVVDGVTEATFLFDQERAESTMLARV
jgi:hypothetical protein